MALVSRAVVKGAFELSERGTIVSVEILEGKVAAGDQLLVPMKDGHMRPTVVRASASSTTKSGDRRSIRISSCNLNSYPQTTLRSAASFGHGATRTPEPVVG